MSKVRLWFFFLGLFTTALGKAPLPEAHIHTLSLYAREAGGTHRVLQKGDSLPPHSEKKGEKSTPQAEFKNSIEEICIQGKCARFEGRKSHFLFEGVKVDLPGPLSVSPGGQILIHQEPWETYVEPLFKREIRFSKKQPVVFLDPGHGGSQPGASNSQLNLIERELTLEVTKHLAKLLEAAGWKIIFSRESDTTVSLEARSQKANESGADIFVSVHFNSAANLQASGLETYLLTSGDERLTGTKQNGENLVLAWSIQAALLKKMQWRDRGVRRARFKVLQDLEIPGILVELGFLSNREEGMQLQQTSVREKLAEGIMEGLQQVRK